ncbi:MAG: hypothetical protein ACFCUR_09870 [Rhodomicrobiaceae bacterium]
MIAATARLAIRFLALTPLLLGLAGCFKSDSPLVAGTDAVFPFQTLTVKTPDGETGILKRVGDVYVYSEPDAQPETEKHQSVLLYKVGDNLYLAQNADEDGEATYILAKRDGDTILARADCRGLDEDTLAQAGIEPPKRGSGLFYECRAADLKSLVALAKSPAIWADHTTALQILSIE